MAATLRNPLRGRFSIREARALCYALGPLSSAVMLHLRQYGDVWSVRFHAFHSLLMAALWGGSWGLLRLIEAVSPWFLATVAREARFALDLAFFVVWTLLLATAYEGSRCAVVPLIHGLAVRLARRSTRYRQAPAAA